MKYIPISKLRKMRKGEKAKPIEEIRHRTLSAKEKAQIEKWQKMYLENPNNWND